jgi:hypothetical protein
MLRRRKDVDWALFLPPEDVVYLKVHIDAQGWYPMETFERLGLAILRGVEHVTLDTVRLWGRFSARQFAGEHPDLVAQNEPLESLMRLKVMRSTLFDFPAFDVPLLADGHAQLSMAYYMGPEAEEAACYQTLGFCEEVLTLAHVSEVTVTFRERSWAGGTRTLVDLEWSPPRY